MKKYHTFPKKAITEIESDFFDGIIFNYLVFLIERLHFQHHIFVRVIIKRFYDNLHVWFGFQFAVRSFHLPFRPLAFQFLLLYKTPRYSSYLGSNYLDAYLGFFESYFESYLGFFESYIKSHPDSYLVHHVAKLSWFFVPTLDWSWNMKNSFEFFSSNFQMKKIFFEE